METKTFKITGMHCDGCAARLQKLLERAEGVRAANVSFAAGEGQVTFNPDIIDENRLKEIIKKAGFDIAS